MEPPKVLSVSELALIIKENLETDIRLLNVWVKGEISDFKHHRASGHCYFTLKDEHAVLPAVMFRRRALALDFQMEDGLTVLARGRVGIYEKSGRYQLYVEEVEPFGIGQLAIKLEQLKQRLMAEGLFDENRKRPLPEMPRTVGVVTSRDGAAIHDIIEVIRMRAPWVDIVVAPVTVQGEEAPLDIARGIEQISLLPEVEVIIVGRGGGSFQDLFAFNSEEVVRAVAACPVPVISAVGHEVDVTLCDLVADQRATTPTQAGVLAVPDRKNLEEGLRLLTARLSRAMKAFLQRREMELDQLSASRVLEEPENILLPRRELLKRLLSSRVFTDAELLTRQPEEKTLYWSERLILAMRIYLRDKEQNWERKVLQLEAVNPLRILGRGYVLVRDEHGSVVDSSRKLVVGQEVNLTFSDGNALARITALPGKEAG